MREPIFIHQMARIGSTSVIRSIKKSTGKKDIHKLFFLNNDVAKLILNCDMSGTYFEFAKNLIKKSSYFRNELKLLNNNHEKYFVISLVRDPVAWLVSFFFIFIICFGKSKNLFYVSNKSLKDVKCIDKNIMEADKYLHNHLYYNLKKKIKKNREKEENSPDDFFLKLGNKEYKEIKNKINFVNKLIIKLKSKSGWYLKINAQIDKINKRVNRFNKRIKICNTGIINVSDNPIKLKCKTVMSNKINISNEIENFDQIKKINRFDKELKKEDLNKAKLNILFKEAELKFYKFIENFNKPISKEIKNKMYYDICHIPLSFFDKEIKEFHGVDVYKEAFDKEKGYNIYFNDNVKLLLIKLEKLNEISNEVFEDFLEIDNFKGVGKYNSSEDLIDVYKFFCHNLHIPINVLKKYYNSKYVRHFYNDQEIESFIKKWE